MTVFLLDANVLIALLDPMHIHHNAAHAWFQSVGNQHWATCPLTENAVLRIIGSPRYPNSPGPPSVVGPMLAQMVALPGHVFWPDDVSLLHLPTLDFSRLLDATQVTDSYLLALACAHGGQLATFDRRLVVDAVQEGTKGLHLIA